jgi:dTDP-4-dehydrorhamnose reductase
VRVLVLGAGGMLGHMLCRVLGERHDVLGTTRGSHLEGTPLERFLPTDRWVPGVDARQIDSVVAALAMVRPDAVVNCIGIVKQLAEAQDPIRCIECNALFPHRLAALCRAVGARMIHLSTDCVFSGRRGNYTERDIPDPVDLYGRTKLLGETGAGDALTIRISIVGRQLDQCSSLFEWARAHRGGVIRGFDRAIYTGLTTMAMARVIDELLIDHSDLSGIWQVASEPITKYQLLCELNDKANLKLSIDRDTTLECDRSLDASAFRNRTGVRVPSWAEMMREFADDQPNYVGIG